MMEKKLENGPPAPPSSVGDYEDNQSTFTVDQPPPAYRKPDLPAVKMTKIVAATILLVTFIAGVTAVAIVYMQHNMKCAQMVTIQEIQTSGIDPELPVAAKVVQEEDETTASTSTSPASAEKNTGLPDLLPIEAENQLKKLSFPIHIDMDDITGRMMEKNQRARLNCVIEKKRSEEIIPRAPKTLQTPFGNLTTDPKFTHITGETMSLTCRSGNERVSRPVSEKPAPSPILIQIPIHRGAQAPPPQSPSPVKPSPNANLRPPAMQQAPLHLQQQPPLPQHHPQAAPSHQVNIQGPMPLHPQGLPPMPEQHHRMLNPFQQLRIPFVPLPQFPQIPLRDVIPHLLDIHKQIQQQRQEEEQQQRQQERQRNKMPRRPEQRGGNDDDDDDNDDVDDDDHEDNMMHGSPESQVQGRALPMHEIPLQRIPGPHPFMQMPHRNQPPQQHLRPEPQRQLRPEPPQHLRPDLPQHLRPNLPPQQLRPEPVGPHPQQKPMEQQQHHQNSHEEEHGQHLGGPNGHLEGAPSFHNMPQVVPTEMMMERAEPLPFIIGSHNMQPRSSARPRMKRMAGACSCVCK